MFTISNSTINCQELSKNLENKNSGAKVIFQGIVRDSNEGKKVKSLEYEAYEELALLEGKKILAQAIERFDLQDAVAYHRQGHLEIGETAVWIGVLSKHRREAYLASRFIIDTLKSRLPIWKKEHYVDKSSAWINCQSCHDNKFEKEEKSYYQRQEKLPEFKNSGQKHLSQSKILVVGAGGLGVPALTYLASAGIGHLVICDPDQLDISNLHRQTLYAYKDIGKNKAELAKDKLLKLNPFIKISALNESITTENINKYLEKCDLALDCCDNFSTKFLLNDACYLKKIPLISASIYKSEGQIHFLNTLDSSPCLRCLWKDIPSQDCTGKCSEVGVLGATVGVFGSLQASEAIKYLLDKKSFSSNFSIIYDLQDHDFLKIKRTKNKDCPLCSEDSTIQQILPKNYNQNLDSLHEIDYTSLDLSSDLLIDIREKSEIEELSKKTFQNKPLSSFNKSSLSKDKRTIIICQSGYRSQKLTNELRNEGFSFVYSLKGGINNILVNNEKV